MTESLGFAKPPSSLYLYFFQDLSMKTILPIHTILFTVSLIGCSDNSVESKAPSENDLISGDIHLKESRSIRGFVLLPILEYLTAKGRRFLKVIQLKLRLL